MSQAAQTDPVSLAFDRLCQALRSQPTHIPLHAQFRRWLWQHGAEAWSFDLVAHPDLAEVLDSVFRYHHLVDPTLSRLTAEVLKRRHGIHASLSAEPDVLQRLAADRLVLQWLERTINTDVAWESLLKRIRRCLLFDTDLAEALLPLAVALARQCFNNEYIFTAPSDELDAVIDIERSLDRAFVSRAYQRLEVGLALVGMYRPLHRLALAPQIATLPLHDFSEAVGPMVVSLLHEPLEEQRRVEMIPSFGTITAPATRAVREQYETSPYPRWFQLRPPGMSLPTWLYKTYHVSITARFPNQRLQFLVAGCGTGQEPLSLAVSNPQSDILAIDLSRASLAYSQRMAAKFGIPNVTFLHGDLTAIECLKRQFHHIVCVGVLHHLPSPIEGWRALEQVLLPGGTMQVGVYSRMARLPVTLARRAIAQHGFDASPDHLRCFRDMLLHEPRYRGLRRAVVHTSDFYYLSGFRDLLFHVCEHHYTLTELEQTLNQCQLALLGARLLLPALITKYADYFPGERRVDSFTKWRCLEKDYFGTLNLFICWLEKSPARC